MKRWGVRWIFCWLSVLVTTACGQILSTPTPTEESTDRVLTLQNFIPPSTASPDSTLRPQTTITPHQVPQSTALRLTTITPTPNLTTETPICYETAVNSLVCLGWVQNYHSAPITNAIIHFYLLNAQGDLLVAEEIPASISVIMPQEGSAYRVVVDKIPEQTWSVYAEINYAEILQIEPYIPPDLQILRQQMTRLDNGYQINGNVVAGDSEIQQVRIVASIRNQTGQLTGFRVMHVELVDSQGQFSLSITPLDGQMGEVTVQVEAIR